MATERTLIIFKPDCMEKRHVGAVLARFEQAGFTIIASKLARLQPAQLREHYAHVASLPFYPDIENFMSRAPVVIMGLQGDGIVQKIRDLLGPTDSRKAAKGTIRGDYGTDMMVNVCHASDSVENGAKEIARFFRPEEVFAPAT
jgi:nucleoside-diphosphate kinase